MGKIFISFLLCNAIISLVQYLYTCLPYTNKLKFLTDAFLERRIYLLSVQNNVAKKAKENSGT